MDDRQSDADKRERHGASEKDRDDTKASFDELNVVPSPVGEKASSTTIVQQKSTEYYEAQRKKYFSLQKQLKEIKKQNQMLEEECKELAKQFTGDAASLIDVSCSDNGDSTSEGSCSRNSNTKKSKD